MTQYDIAISYADEDRDVARELANLFYKKYELKIFYDDYEQAELLGKNLTEYLVDIYKNKAKYCVVLISEAYKEKRWTRHEWRAAQARAFEEPEIDYILPVKIDETELPGFLSTIGYLSLKKHTIAQIAEIIYRKIELEIKTINLIRIALNYYQKNDFQNAIEIISDNTFDNEIDALRVRGDSYGKLHEYEKAIEALEKLVKISANDFLGHFLLGIFYYRISNFEKSIQHYEKANKIYPNHPTILSDLPLAREKLNQQKHNKK